jgi:hypothetical protein
MEELRTYFEHPLQLAREHVAMLPSAPWPEEAILGADAAARLDNAARLLETHFAALVEEYHSLDAAGALTRDEDCIAAASQHSPWRRLVFLWKLLWPVYTRYIAFDLLFGHTYTNSSFEATGAWEQRDAQGCSVRSPILCSILHQLVNKRDVRVSECEITSPGRSGKRVLKRKQNGGRKASSNEP